MEPAGVRVEHVVHHNAVSLRRGAAFAGGIVNDNAGLHVVAKNAEINAVALVLHGVTLHPDAAGDRFFIHKNRRDAVENMPVGFLDVVRHKIFKRQHSHHIQVARSGDKIPFIGVFAGKLIADKVAAVVKRTPVHKVVGGALPAAGLHTADGAALLGGHYFGAHIGEGCSAAPERIKVAVPLKGFGGDFVRGEGGRVVVYRSVGLAAVFRNF